MSVNFNERLRLEVELLRKNFRAINEQEQRIFDYMMLRIDNGAPISAEEKHLARIGGTNLLHYLYDRNTYEVDDYSVRLAILRNPRCDELLLSRALHDSDWEVRKASVLDAQTPIEKCFECAKKEGNPYVVEALKERLGDKFPMRTGPQAVAAGYALAAEAPKATGVVQDILANAFARSAMTGRTSSKSKDTYSIG